MAIVRTMEATTIIFLSDYIPAGRANGCGRVSEFGPVPIRAFGNGLGELADGIAAAEAGPGEPSSAVADGAGDMNFITERHTRPFPHYVIGQTGTAGTEEDGIEASGGDGIDGGWQSISDVARRVLDRLRVE